MVHMKKMLKKKKRSKQFSQVTRRKLIFLISQHKNRSMVKSCSLFVNIRWQGNSHLLRATYVPMSYLSGSV